MLNISRANLSDIEPLAALFGAYRRFYGMDDDVGSGRRFLLDRLASDESVIFLARDADKCIGFTQLYPTFSSILLTPALILSDLFVSPEARRQGAASALLGAATDYARNIGASRLSLSTGSDNLTAQALYEREGWTKDTRFIGYNMVVRAGS